MIYFVQAEVKFRGRWKRLYLWQNNLWREARSEAQLFTTVAEAEAAVERLSASERKLRQVMVRPADAPASSRRGRRHWPSRKGWQIDD